MSQTQRSPTIATNLRPETLVVIPLIALISLLVMSAVGTTIMPVQRFFGRIAEALFARKSYDFGSTLEHFSRELATLRDQESITNLLLDGLYKSLNLRGIAYVALPDGLDAEMLQLIEIGDLRARGTYATVKEQQAILKGLASLDVAGAAIAQNRPLVLHPWPSCAALLFIGTDTSNTGGLALLVIGPKNNSSGLRSEDQRLLITLAHQAATALANAVLLAGVQTSLQQLQLSTAQLVAARSEQRLLLRKLVDADERQRAALAQDLHDDALQEVLYLIRHSRQSVDLAAQLELVLDEPTDRSLAENLQTQLTFRRQTLQRLRLELAQLSERSSVAEQRLRALYLGLYPVLLNTLGLVASLEDLIMDLSTNTTIAIQFDYNREAAEAATKLDAETALHIYRITQEGLRNISKHAKASWVRVQLNAGGQSYPERQHRSILHLVIEDNGVGLPFPLDFITLLGEGHLGLAGMRERAERIGGVLTFAPRPEGGASVILEAPLFL